ATGDLVSLGLVCYAHAPTDGTRPLTHPGHGLAAGGERGLTEVVVVNREHPASGVDRPVGGEGERDHRLDVLLCAGLSGLGSQGRSNVSPFLVEGRKGPSMSGALMDDQAGEVNRVHGASG